MNKRCVFYVSDGTGITAESLGHALTAQFVDIEFEPHTFSFINNVERAKNVVGKINLSFNETGTKPLVFATLVNPAMRLIIGTAECVYVDFFETFTPRLESILDKQVTHEIGRSHAVINYEKYKTRIDAINYTLNSDDGLAIQHYTHADIILIGVSRCGKTPTSLYLAMHCGLYIANYPLTEDDLSQDKLPEFLLKHKAKLFGLTIDAERLHSIRNERRPDSEYASIKQCKKELELAQHFYKEENIPFLNTTTKSIEEIATEILSITGTKRRFY